MPPELKYIHGKMNRLAIPVIRTAAAVIRLRITDKYNEISTTIRSTAVTAALEYHPITIVIIKEQTPPINAALKIRLSSLCCMSKSS